MPCISIFADEEDAKVLLDWLNSEEEIAFIIPDITQDSPQQKWKAIRTIDSFNDGKYSLWHISGGLLPFVNVPDSPQVVFDSWKACIEQHASANSTKTYFGLGHSAEIRLELWLRHHPYSETEKTTLPVLISWWMENKDLLAASDFQWIGNRYEQAPQQTHRWWKRLKVFVARKAIRLTPSGQRWSFWAFPSAFRKLKNGMAYSSRGWDLTEAIRTAKEPEL
jgi:hypothetical protein